ncbi:CpaF family protein [Propionibacteriaceae bacterium Y2011]|uniref:CpaF family protein n=1 Tax=Microlunatus sp. Y2014 TaxID=3418488 RepID=UPI003B4E62A4
MSGLGVGGTEPAALYLDRDRPAVGGGGADVPHDTAGVARDGGRTVLRERPAHTEVDWRLVYRIRDRLAERLATSAGPDVAEETRVARGRAMIGDVIREHSDEAILAGRPADQVARAEVAAYTRAVDSAVFGYGRWQPLLDDPDVENIEIRGHDHVFLTYADRVEQADPVADSDAELIEQLTFIATYAKTPKPFSPAHPEMTINLQDRFRLHAVAFDVVDRPTIVIRQHKFTGLSLPELAGAGMMPDALAGFLAAAVRAHRSIVVSGNQGVGKTTFVRALAMAMDPGEAVGVIETDAELFLHKLPGRGRVINFVAREGSGEGTGADGRPLGEFSVQRHLAASLRQNLSRVVVGEVRDAEAAAMFQAMQSGAGSLSTIHAQHSRATIERLVTAAALGGVMSQADAYRQIAVNLHLIVHLGAIDERSTGGRLRRYVNEVIEVHGFAERSDGMASSLPALATLYEAGPGGAPGRLADELLSPELRRGLARAGWRP